MFEAIVPKKSLQPLLERAERTADRKSAVPALANVLLTATDGTLTVAATDIYLGMTGSTACDVMQLGSIAVPAKDLLERVKAMPEGPIQITATAGAQVTLKAVGQARRYTLAGLPGHDFPTLPKPTDDRVIEAPLDVLSRLLTRTHFSISTDETRAHVNSLLVEWSGDLVRVVSTDGHRLTKAEAKIEGAGTIASMLIPLKAVTQLRALLDGAKGEKTVTIQHGRRRRSVDGSGTAFFTVAGMRFSVRLIDAQFPPWKQVVPEKTDTAVSIPRTRFVDALKAVKVASSDRTGGVKLALVPGALRITSESPESGAGFDEIAVDYNDIDRAIGVNAQYAIDVLTALDCEDVVLGVSGELDPMTITPAGGADFIGVIMPMRLG